MFGLELWVLWIIVGIIFMIIEIFTPGFYFMSIGAAAILTGLAGFFVNNQLFQIILFIVLCFLFFVFLRKFALQFFLKVNTETNVMALVGKKAKVTKQISEDERGYVKIEGEEWVAISNNNELLEVGDKVKVIKIDGTKVVVQKEKEKE
ncbi:MAG: NfeD family protein [Candidatus Cloacimonadota bacterium]|nr:NfeD family protein [Candidatus Cloacimonadota bacterium]